MNAGFHIFGNATGQNYTENGTVLTSTGRHSEDVAAGITQCTVLHRLKNPTVIALHSFASALNSFAIVDWATISESITRSFVLIRFTEARARSR